MIKRKLLTEKHIKYYKNNEWISVEHEPTGSGSYLCFMLNCYIKMCYFDGEKWLDMWQSELSGYVSYWRLLPESPIK